ncbi:hypothetical protein AN958_05583 [Leucoagaricus sp. SymC.cos]|nr:hypothetical protein AN958_05583 [Leucoagaricus sp. SymC.cos]
MSFKPEERYVIHNIVDPRPVQRTGLDSPLTLVNQTNSYAKWIITNNGDQERYVIQNAGSNCYAHLKETAVSSCDPRTNAIVDHHEHFQAIIESPNPLTRWKIKVVSPSMYRVCIDDASVHQNSLTETQIYDPASQLFWTTHPDSNEIFLEPFSPGSDQWWAISSAQ